LAKTHYTGYYCGRSPGGREWTSNENTDDPEAEKCKIKVVLSLDEPAAIR